MSMKKFSFFSVIVALTFMFSACNKSVSDQIADEGTMVGVKQFVWTCNGTLVEDDAVYCIGGKRQLYTYSQVTASDFAHFMSSGTQFNNNNDKPFPVYGLEGAILHGTGNGNSWVYINFNGVDYESLNLEGTNCTFSIGVRFKGSVNAVYTFNLEECIGAGDIKLLDRGMGTITQIRFMGDGAIRCEEEVEPYHMVYFYKNKCDYENNAPFYEEPFYFGTLTTCPYFNAGQSQENFIWHPFSDTKIISWAECDGVYYNYLKDVQAAFFKVTVDEWTDGWVISDGDSGLPFGDQNWPKTGLTADVHIYAIIDYKTTDNCDGSTPPPVTPTCDDFTPNILSFFDEDCGSFLLALETTPTDDPIGYTEDNCPIYGHVEPAFPAAPRTIGACEDFAWVLKEGTTNEYCAVFTALCKKGYECVNGVCVPVLVADCAGLKIVTKNGNNKRDVTIPVILQGTTDVVYTFFQENFNFQNDNNKKYSFTVEGFTYELVIPVRDNTISCDKISITRKVK